MSDSKKPPSVVDDVQGDLKKVGGFFKSLWRATERVNRGVEEATRDPLDEVPPQSSAAKRIRAQRAERQPQVIDSPQACCGVCGGTKVVGDKIKIPCPQCAK